MNIEELENKIKELNEELENLKKELKEEKIKEGKRWRAKAKEKFFSISSYGNIYRDIYYISDDGQDKQYQLGNHFKTEEQAEKQLKKLEIYMQLKDLALRLNDGEKIDWNNDCQLKYCIFYNSLGKKLDYSCSYRVKELGQIYCLSGDFFNIAKEDIGEKNIKFLFGVEE